MKASVNFNAHAHFTLRVAYLVPMFNIQWWKVYHLSYLQVMDVTEEIDNFLEHNQWQLLY